MEINVKNLVKLFAGKKIHILHTNNAQIRNESGFCKTFHETESGIDMELINGNRYGFKPDTLTEDGVEGKIANYITGRRRFQLAE